MQEFRSVGSLLYAQIYVLVNINDSRPYSTQAFCSKDMLCWGRSETTVSDDVGSCR